jgi:hypothetical protein
MIITGIVQNKILTGFAKGDKASLDGAGQVGFSNAINNAPIIVAKASSVLPIFCPVA